ncbi:MAG: response regulator [Saprospiraceae bacterium]|nr:response regulator [Saprospiraceae bacterium]
MNRNSTQTKVVLFIICLGVLCPLLNAQDAKIDSLENRLLLNQPDTSRVKDLLALGFSYRIKNQDRADTLFTEALQLSKKINYPNGIAMAYQRRANLWYNKSEYDSCLYWGNIALDYALEQKLVWEEALIRSILASAYQSRFNYEEALAQNYRVREVFNKMAPPDYQAAINMNIGDIHFHRASYDTALIYYFESARIKDQVGLSHFAVVELNSIANVYQHQGDQELAMEYIWKALARIDSTQNAHEFASIMAVKCRTHLSLGQLDSALIAGRQAIQISESLKLKSRKMWACWPLGNTFYELDQRDSAIYYYNQGYAIAREIKDLSFQSIFSYQLGLISLEEGNLAAAKTLAEESYQKALDAQTVRERVWSTGLLAAVYDSLGQKPEAYDLYKEHILFRDSLAGSTKNIRLIELERKYRTQEQQAQLSQQQLTILKETQRRKWILFSSVAAVLFLIGLMLFIRTRLLQKRHEAEFALRLKETEALRLQELDTLKSTFFANISHEFRTPLTLIMSPAEQMIEGKIQGDSKNYLQIIYRNGKRLLQLVNQLLDLSKLESGKLSLNLQDGDVFRFVRSIAMAFESLGYRKNIQYNVSISKEPLAARFDPDVLEKILNNLLSNAFKFTPEDGTIFFKLEYRQSGNQLFFEVHNSGPGIGEDKIDQIFDRFFSERSNEIVGTGIGLALTKELVLLHEGTIGVSSIPESGSTFEVSIPFIPAENPESLSDFTLTLAPPIVNLPIQEESDTLITTELPIVLIVEDNSDLRMFIRDQLRPHFEVQLAENGQEGLRMAREIIPDLIITDLMMPEMDGNELTAALQTDERTSHIPVVMLTAKAEKEDRITGLRVGADAYLAKPFHAEELRATLDRLLRKNQILKEKYQQGKIFVASPVAVDSVDDTFINLILSTIEEHIDDELFGVRELAIRVNMSRSQLHRKLKALTEKSPNEIIREVRLNRAKELLEKQAGNASEVAFMVGFSSASYFSKCFKDQFGISPTEV